MATPAYPVQQMYVQPPTNPIPLQQPYLVQHVYQYPAPLIQPQGPPIVNKPSCAYRFMLWFFWLVGATILLGLMAIFPCNSYKDLLMYTSGIIVGLIPMAAFNKCCRSQPPVHQTMPASQHMLPAIAYIPKIPGISVSTQTQCVDSERGPYNPCGSEAVMYQDMALYSSCASAPPPYEG